FPHHESELAQAEGVPGPRPFVRHWVHTGTVHMAGEKMSKSLGNLAFVDEVLERHEPAGLRAFLLRRHYRSDWSFREEDLAGERTGAGTADADGDREPFDPVADRTAFFRALDEDLDTPSAMRILDRAARS